MLVTNNVCNNDLMQTTLVTSATIVTNSLHLLQVNARFSL